MSEQFKTLSQHSHDMSEYILATKESINYLNSEFSNILQSTNSINDKSEDQVLKNNEVETIGEQLSKLTITNVNHLYELNVVMVDLGTQ